MANEHVLLVQRSQPVKMTVADATGIEQGTVLKLTSPNTATASAAAEDVVCGIAYNEKIANDGVTAIAVITGPGDRLKAVASGTVTMGDPLVTAVAADGNRLASAIGRTTVQLSGTRIIGRALETVTAGQSFMYELNIQTLPIG